MKKIVILLISISIWLGGARAQSPSTLGTDFWVTYLSNNIDGSPYELSLIITGMRNCSGSVYNLNTGWSTIFNVTAGVITNVTIPLTAAYTTASETITNTGIHITSTDTISCYASNFRDFTFDVTNVLPTPTLRDEYVVQTYPSERGCEFVILAVEDSTTVDFTPTYNTLGGRYADSTYSITLQRGQCYQVQTSGLSGYSGYGNDDFSGTRICARDCKKIAVFQGDYCANIPNSSSCCCDHIVEQSIPIDYWGKKFIVTTSEYRSNDVIRITALNNGCQVSKDGVLLTTLNARQTYELQLSSTENAVYIETTEPACVFLYFTGYDYGGNYGDPSSVLITPIEQQIEEITFGTFATPNGIYHVVNIVAETANVGGITLDGVNVSSQFNVVTGNPTYSYAKITVQSGSHTLRNSMGGFLAHIYGLGVTESYSYIAGSSAKNLSSQLLVNDVPSSILTDGTTVCPFSPITFEAQIEYQYTDVNWYFGDGETASGPIVTHQYDSSADYDVRVIIADNCSNDFYDTLYTIIHVSTLGSHVTSATVCPGRTYNFNGVEYAEAGRYTDTIPSDEGCDSLDILELTLSEVVPDVIEAVICQGMSYEFRDTSYTEEGSYEKWVHTPGECDSLFIIDLSFSDIPSVEVDATICPGETYTFQGETFNDVGRYEVMVEKEEECDTLFILNITISCIFDPELPNVITPNGDGVNDVFIVKDMDPEVPNTLTIYNRWGKKVYEKENYRTYIWEGETTVHNPTEGFTAEGLSDGVFYYVFHYEDSVKSVDYHGTVTVIR